MGAGDTGLRTVRQTSLKKEGGVGISEGSKKNITGRRYIINHQQSSLDGRETGIREPERLSE